MHSRIVALLVVVAVAFAAGARGARTNGPMSSAKPSDVPAASAALTDAQSGGIDVEKLFANTCGWCHSNGGRSPGKGPQLMGTTLTDAEIIDRIKAGKTGAMPAFGSSFSDQQLQAIVRYIRSLRE